MVINSEKCLEYLRIINRINWFFRNNSTLHLVDSKKSRAGMIINSEKCLEYLRFINPINWWRLHQKQISGQVNLVKLINHTIIIHLLISSIPVFYIFSIHFVLQILSRILKKFSPSITNLQELQTETNLSKTVKKKKNQSSQIKPYRWQFEKNPMTNLGSKINVAIRGMSIDENTALTHVHTWQNLTKDWRPVSTFLCSIASSQ